MIARVRENNVQHFRNEMDYTQDELACKVGCSRETISRLESGMYSPSLDLIDRIAVALGCTVYDLMPMSSAPMYRAALKGTAEETREVFRASMKRLIDAYC